MLSFCFENSFTDAMKSHGHTQEYLDNLARHFEFQGDDFTVDGPYNFPPEITKEFYNGLGKQFGYNLSDGQKTSLDNRIRTGIEAGMMQPYQFNTPLEMSNAEKEDLVKNGSDYDKFLKLRPEYHGPDEGKIPFSLMWNPPEYANPNNNFWGGI